MVLSSIIYYGVVGYLLLKIFRRFLQTRWGSVDKNNEISCKGKIVLVTGSNAGIGRAAALEFAERDANIILACRSEERANEAIQWIRQRTGLGQLIWMELDLTSLKAVKKFTEEFKSKYDRLDILVNNAGVMLQTGDNQTTKDGLEIHFGVNHVGHFLLTNLLLEPLKKAAPSRIVTVSSFLHEEGKLDLDDKNFEKTKNQTGIVVHPMYNTSKLANMYFNMELSKRLQGTGIRTYAMCPGAVATDLGRNLSGVTKMIVEAMTPLWKMFVKTPEEGAATIIHCALSKSLINESGKMYRNCGVWPANQRIPLRDEDAKRLWNETESIVKAFV